MIRAALTGLSAAVFGVAVLALPVRADDASSHSAHSAPGGAIGKVDFPISCSAASQLRFDQAVWMLHSFWYEESLKAFTAITEAEPECAMGYWGMAMSDWYPLWFPPSAEKLKAGAAAVAKGVAAGPGTQRERAWLEAIGRFYQDSETRDHRTRALAYEDAMAALHARWPDDREAAIFYALALDATSLPTDKSYANLKKAASILEAVWPELPDHPGIVHYLIHSYDTPALAEAGLTAARRYAAIAPAVPHAQHMPSHIFTRLGLWEESIQSNLAGHRAAADYAAQTFGPGGYDQETVHTLDYLAYAYLQTAQDRAAKGVVEEIAGLRNGPPATLPIAYAFAAIPARYVLERRDWPAAATLAPAGAGIPWERFPWAAAMTSFTRALGAAHVGDTTAASSELAKLQGFEETLRDAKNDYWANQVKVQRLGAGAVLAAAEGDRTRALELSRQAAALEEGMDKHPATPGAVLPARELRADLLLEGNDAAAALEEYRQVLRHDPNRFRSVLGEARAARRAGDDRAAQDAYHRLGALCDDADTQRPELAEARQYLDQ